MPTNTPNYNLVKPTQEEFYNVDVPNNNMDIIDRLLKEFQDAITSGATEQELKVLRESFVTHLEEKATLEKVGHVQLDDSTDSTSTTKAATANAVNTVKKLISNVANFAVATAAEAKAGLVSNKYMTPLRTKEAIAELVPKSDVEILLSEYDFSAIPISRLDISNLNNYKKVIVEGNNVSMNTIASLFAQINNIDTNSYHANRISGTSVASANNRYLMQENSSVGSINFVAKLEERNGLLHYEVNGYLLNNSNGLSAVFTYNGFINKNIATTLNTFSLFTTSSVLINDGTLKVRGVTK